MKVLAVDLGGRRTGLAISDPEGRLAMALPTLEDATPEDVARVAEEHQAGEVLVGLPLNMDGTVGPSARRAMDFAEELRTRVKVPVVLWDERLSSAEGHARLRAAGLSRRARARRVDAAAAIVILESYLTRPRGAADSSNAAIEKP